jgi:two-component system alkaline phosphatase synthesis response regulator PhoP
MAKILVVDDEPDIVEIITFTLESKGHEITSAKDGAEGIEQVKKDEPDLIILDVMMPKMNGMQVVDYLRNKEQYNHIPIIMLTATTQYSRKPDEEWRKKIGVEDYISKPFEPIDLITRVDKVLKDNFRQKGDGLGRFKIK